MSDTAVYVENLSKQYRIGTGRAPYKTLRESLMALFITPFRRLHSSFQRSNVATFERSNDDHIWALKVH